MSNPPPAPTATHEVPSKSYALPNTRIVIFTPLIIIVLGAVVNIAAQADVLTAIVAAVIYAIPSAIAYAICLVWRRRLKPVMFFFAGLGMTFAVTAALVAMAFGTCLVIGVSGGFK